MSMDGVRGDARRRVEMPMPRSLREIQQAASRNFGQPGRLPQKFYHFGVTAINHNEHVKCLEDEDVIVVSLQDAAPAAKFGITTHQADFVPKPLEAWSSPSPQPRGETLPFEAVTSYSRDFTARPASAQRRRPRAHAAFSKMSGRSTPEPFTARTTYADHFPGYTADGGKQLVSAANMPQPLPNTRFDAETTHQADYKRHHVVPQLVNTRIDVPMGHRPFEGTTSYADQFSAKQGEPFPKTRRPGDSSAYTANRPPFRGCSEYNREYLEKVAHRPMRIFLEPEEKDPNRSLHLDLDV
eukprot:TRINITY_DN22318_c0_g1_i2.p1 TRINITY_DN22318_c0_g1~~TRINITY_DN22318_c0_g1_i2.p1  ORF type:complete len:297 (-),score=47.25 TRINITY_DN22318_c0_g1_i2:54-944(-)